MGLSALYLADKSALARLDVPAVKERLLPLIANGLVATCRVTRLELGHSVRNADEHAQVMQDHAAVYPDAPIPGDAWSEAGRIQAALAKHAQRRGVGIPDLLIAVTAAAHELTVLHYDHDFDLIAGVTGQPAEWVSRRGSIT